VNEDKRVLMAGNYIGTIEDYGISKSSKDEPQAFIKFKVEKAQGEGFAELTWFGGLSEKVREGKTNSPAHYTIKTLLDCGFKGMEVEDLANGPAGGTIEFGKEMSLVVEDNLYKEVLRSQIKWVNKLGGGMKSLSKEELVGKTNTSSLRAMLLKEKASRPEELEEEIPF